MSAPIFPSLTPSARVWTPGQVPLATFVSAAGYEARVQLGAMDVGQSLSLSFDNRLEAAGKQITDHYAAAKGSLFLFELPAEVYGGMASYGHIKPSASMWRYAGPPSVTYVAPGIVSVSVELVAVPR